MSDEPAAAPDPTAPPPGAKRRALAEEQEHLDRVHDRVEWLRRRAADRVASASADVSGPTFQARFERDVTAHHHAARAARFTFGDVESLVFGRLDLTDGEVLHVGRVSVIDQDGEVLLVDWRAPAAAPFYQATAAEPLGVVRRRTLVTRGREVRDLDDELLDVDAAERLGLVSVTGQGALLASLARERDGHMHDIVATIQRDQDRIIRAPAKGIMVVTGGPGTGKTVVALHRVASLLYRDRARFEGRGVLVIGPSPAFTEYTARVLPSLGEDRAVQRPLAALAPRGVTIRGWDEPEVARIKGELKLVELAERLLAAALPPLPPGTRVTFDGTTVSVDAERLTRLRQRQLATVRVSDGPTSYHERTQAAEEALRDQLWQAWAAEHRAGGYRVPEEREGSGFDTALEASAQVTMLRRCYWPQLDPVEVVAAAARGEVDVREVGEGVLPGDDLARLQAAWQAAPDWTVDDVALLDEVAALVGPSPQELKRRERDDEDVGLQLSSEQLHTEVKRVDVEAEGYRDFAHVVVDEAQDVSALQWRTIRRRAPFASWTIVGDLAQRSRVSQPYDWEEVGRLIGRRTLEVHELTINYRTPVEVVAVADRVLAAAGHDPSTSPQAVRSAGEHPRHLVAEDQLAATSGEVARLLGLRGGTLAVLARPQEVDQLDAAVRAAATEDVDRLTVLDVRAAKGLEFDDVVVVGPDRIAASSTVGLHQLYVAVTRATRSLTLVAGPQAEVPGLEVCRRVTDERP
ncbi:MAG: HelD family protein [Nitriliruptoraceae bacterium]